jgi:hypothetical protein
MPNTPSPRLEARTADAMFFDSGNPCKRGHNALRYTSSGRCIECYKTPGPVDSRVRKIHYSPILRKKDGTVEMLGPFINKKAAVEHYITRHIEVYGVPPLYGIDQD